MALQKVINEEYFSLGSLADYSKIYNKLLSNLEPYSISRNGFLDIPSIPGLKISIESTVKPKKNQGYNLSIKTTISYLETTDKDNLDELRNLILDAGLVKTLIL